MSNEITETGTAVFSLSDCRLEAARITAANEENFFRLLDHAGSFAALGENDGAALLLDKALKKAFFSSDMLDIVRFLWRYPVLQERFSLKKCLQKAEKNAILPGDFAEITGVVNKMKRVVEYGY